jgi:TonB family protein
MATPSDHGVLLTPRQRLGMGAALSAALHVAGLVLLATRVDRAMSVDDVEGWDTVEVSDVGEAPLGPPLPATAPEPEIASTAEPTRSVAEATGAAPDAARPPAEPARPPPPPRRPRPPRVAITPAPPRAATSPASATPTGAEGPGKTGIPAARHPGAAIDVGGRGEKTDAVVPEHEGHSALALFRADLKRRLRAAWRPIEIYQRLDPQGQLQGSRLITAVQVRLRADGTAEQAAVNGSSGFAALDNEALAALRRALPLPRLAPEIIDGKGGFEVRCTFHLDIGLYRFARELHHAIAQEWHPSRAFLMSGDKTRKTVLRLTLSREGALTATSVMTSAGIDFLDSGAQAALKPGIRLPPPPPGFFRKGTAVPVVVAFDHGAGNLHILLPHEALEEDE